MATNIPYILHYKDNIMCSHHHAAAQKAAARISNKILTFTLGLEDLDSPT